MHKFLYDSEAENILDGMSVISGSALILGKKQPERILTPEEKQSEAYELAHKRLGSNTYAPPGQVQPGLPKTNVGLAMKVYPAVSGFLGGVGQSFVNLGLAEQRIITYNVAHPEKALGPSIPTFPITKEEKQYQQDRADVSIFTLSTLGFMVAPELIPAKILGSSVASVAARTLIVSGVGAGTGYVYGGVEGAAVGALMGGGLYLGSVGLSHGVHWLYNYARSPKLPSVGVVDVPDIGYVAPRTMSEKVLGLPQLESPYQLRGLQPLEAESTAWEMSIAPRTSAIDPLAKLVEPPTLTRPIAGMPFLPHPELTARLPSSTFDFLPKLMGASTFLGSQAFGSQRLQKSMPSVSPVLRGVPKLDLGLDLSPDVASSLDLSPLTAQSEMTAQMSKVTQVQVTRQIPRSMQAFSPEFKQLQTPRFDKQNPFNQNFNDLFKSDKRKKSAYEKRYMWEFPVKGPKELWKVV